MTTPADAAALRAAWERLRANAYELHFCLLAQVSGDTCAESGRQSRDADLVLVQAAADAGARPGGRFGTHCPYCNNRIGVFSDMASADEAGKAHIQSCPQHPLAGHRDLIARLSLALTQHLPPDPHGGGGPGHVCDAECEEMAHLSQLLNDARRGLPPAQLLPADAGARARVEEDMLAAVQFWSDSHHEFFYADGPEYDTFLDLATRCGLLAEVPYDPAVHDETPGDAEPGDPIYWPTERAERLRALLAPEGRRDPTKGETNG